MGKLQGSGEQVYKPDSVSRRSGTAIIPLGPELLPGSSDLPESYPRPCGRGRSERAAPPPLFGLAPCGVFPAPDVAIRAVRSYIKSRPAGPHLFTLTPQAGRYIFCGTFRTCQTHPGKPGQARQILAVSQHTALRSPDFPLQ